MLLGYNTNGFAHHRLEDAIEIIAEIGYRAVAVTIEPDLLDPPSHRGVDRAAARLRSVLNGSGLVLTIETGSRFILDPRRKHQPTLISGDSAERRRRLDFLKAAIDLAAAASSEDRSFPCVSLWSGAADDAADEASLFARLDAGMGELHSHAEAVGVRLGFEPEPGMLIDTMERFARLHEHTQSPLFGLTLDVGHVVCLGDGEIADHVVRWRERLFNVHLEDMRPGTHEHLMFGEGEVDFVSVFAAFRAADYKGPMHVELSRHSQDAVVVARRSFEFLNQFST